MNFISRIINTLVWMWRLTELAEKVNKAEQDILDMDGRIDARFDKSWKDLDSRLDQEKSKASSARAEMREDIAHLKGAMDEINRKRHGST